MDLVILRSQAGAEALHVAELGQRHELLAQPEYQRRFRKHWKALFSPRIYHRNLERLSCERPRPVDGRPFIF